MKSRTILYILFMLGIAACTDEKPEFLEGTWERVNVRDIEASSVETWTFDNSVLTISLTPKSGGGSVVRNTGIYRLKTSLFGTEIRIDNTSNELYNNDWDVIKLTVDQLIMKRDLTTGVMYFEFVKKP